MCSWPAKVTRNNNTFSCETMITANSAKTPETLYFWLLILCHKTQNIITHFYLPLLSHRNGMSACAQTDVWFQFEGQKAKIRRLENYWDCSQSACWLGGADYNGLDRLNLIQTGQVMYVDGDLWNLTEWMSKEDLYGLSRSECGEFWLVPWGCSG